MNCWKCGDILTTADGMNQTCNRCLEKTREESGYFTAMIDPIADLKRELAAAQAELAAIKSGEAVVIRKVNGEWPDKMFRAQSSNNLMLMRVKEPNDLFGMASTFPKAVDEWNKQEVGA